MSIRLSEIISCIKSDIVKNGSTNIPDLEIRNISNPTKVDKFSLDWINPARENKQQIAENSKAKAIVCDVSLEYTDEIKKQGKVLIFVKNPKFSIAKIGEAFFVKRPQWGIDPTASIDQNAKISNRVSIGKNTIIGEATIGENVIIYPNVIISDLVEIGNNVTIKPGAILGFEGFGIEKDENNNLYRFPQLGRLIIKDNVEIGANTCIDRGALGDTIIGFNTKISNLCNISHNVVIGENVTITANVMISGSTVIGDNAWIAPNSCFRGHQVVGKEAVIGLGAVVIKDVPDGETWGGNPAKKIAK